MAGDVERGVKDFLILQELNKFDDPAAEQRLELIQKKLGMSKQSLNYYLNKKFIPAGIIKKVQSYPYAIYELTPKGRAVKENLGHSEPGVKRRIWRLHNIIVGFRIRSWGSWKFGKTTPMNNWSYQEIRLKSGPIAHVQTTNLLKIYVPEKCGQDPEIMRGQGYAEGQQAAQWFVDKYNLILEPMHTIRKGQKTLLGSKDLAKLFGRVNTNDFFVDASEGEENLEEPEDSFAIEHILEGLQETPGRLENLEKAVDQNLRPVVQDLARNIALHLDVMRNINTAITELRTEISGARIPTQAPERSTSVFNGFPGSVVNNNTPKLQEPKTRDLTQYTEDPVNISTETLDDLGPDTRVKVKILEDLNNFTLVDAFGLEKSADLRAGSRIYMIRDNARDLIKAGVAQRIRED